MNPRRLLIFTLLGAVIIATIAACGANQTIEDQIAPTENLFEEEASLPAHAAETPAPPPEQKNLRPAIYPGVPPQAERILADSDASHHCYLGWSVTILFLIWCDRHFPSGDEGAYVCGAAHNSLWPGMGC
jgi:hypothetical protein